MQNNKSNKTLINSLIAIPKDAPYDPNVLIKNQE